LVDSWHFRFAMLNRDAKATMDLLYRGVASRFQAYVEHLSEAVGARTGMRRSSVSRQLAAVGEACANDAAHGRQCN
jgi:DNA-binding transcriptional ArsR family regulator